MKILITSSNHFVALHLVEHLIALNHDVRIIVPYAYYNLQFLPKFSHHSQHKIDIIMGDIRNSDIVKHAISEIEVVFHFNTADVMPTTDIHFKDFLETNIMGTNNILRTSSENKIKKLIYISTGDIYGKASIIPTDEDQPTNPLSPQIAACIGTEKLIEGYSTGQNLPITIARLFNPYGPMQSKQAIIPTIVLQAFIKPNVFLGNMHAERDFIHVDDVVEGLLKVMDSEQLVGEKINFGSGTGISIGNLAEKILNIINKDVEILFDATRIRPEHQDVEKIIADITKANDLLDWRPRTSIEAGLSNTIDWFAEHLNAKQLSERI